MASSWQQRQQVMDLSADPYEVLGVSRAAGFEEIRRSYKQRALETHPDKVPSTASEEEKKLAQDLFYQVQEAFGVLNDPSLRRAYDIHHRPLPAQRRAQANFRVSTVSRAATLVPTSAPITTPTPTPAKTSTTSRNMQLVPSPVKPPHSGTVAPPERLDEAHERRMKERSEWARKAEERRLDGLKVYTASEEIQNLGQRQAALIDKMIQDLFALTPEWEVRRMKARAYKASRASAVAR